jgi:hypothetical protein
MAKKVAKADKKAGKAAGAKPGVSRLVMTVGLIALIPFSIPTMILLFAGLLPTLVAALTDRSHARYAWICVGGLNFAGLAPALLTLWFGHHELTYALGQITNVRVLLMAYSAAAVGWMLYFAAPPIVITVMLATSKRRASSLQQKMKKLEEEWGSEVAGNNENQ